jgi:hypothetical protein
MSTSIEAKILELHLRHFTQEAIAPALRTRRDRISRCLREFQRSDAIPESHHIGQPSIRGSELIACAKARTLQTPSLSEVYLARQVREHLALAISRSTVNSARLGMQFKYHLPRQA